MKEYFLFRIKEPSTWRGFTLLLTAIGFELSYEQYEVIIAAGLSIAGIIGILFPDNVEK